MKTNTRFFTLALFLLVLATLAPAAFAMELDWSGQFRSEFNMVRNYTLDSSGAAYDPTRDAAGGYYIAGNGRKSAEFNSLFVRLKPKMVVNDNVYIKSEFWLGDPVFGAFGTGFPYQSSQKYYNTTFTRPAEVSAARFWGEFLTDFGTLEVGRAPLHYGLGVVWNSGDGAWDRYQSTGDVVRLVSKFGSFSFIPSFISYSTGNSVSGSIDCTSGTTATGRCNPGNGLFSGASEFSLQIKYENPDEKMEAGLNFMRRLGGQDQDSSAATTGVNGGVAPYNYNIWDIYGRKSIGAFSFGLEAPIVTGSLSGLNYSAFAFATELRYEFSPSWAMDARAGHAPGQPNFSGTMSDFKAFSFHPSYQLGMVMFHYQLANFYGPNNRNNPNVTQGQLLSPYDNPITNANYLALSGTYTTDKWKFNLGLVYAKATDAAVAGSNFYNQWSHNTALANGDQSTSLGLETDLGITFQYDETFQFRVNTGFWFPGDFYKFSNVAGSPNGNATSTVWATTAGVGVSF